MALANRLVENSVGSAALETTLTGATLKFFCSASVAVTGADARCKVNGNEVEMHVTQQVNQGDELLVGAATRGVRSYIAVGGGLQAERSFGSTSTYVAAGIGGYRGRALRAGDELQMCSPGVTVNALRTPDEFRLPMLDSWSLRACHSSETVAVKNLKRVFGARFSIAARNDRMGIELDGAPVATSGSGKMASVPVFPGTVQCPQNGRLYVLSVDAGTTGGYPRVAKVARMDLHALGQLRLGDSLAFIEREEGVAADELLAKHKFWQPWLPDVATVI